MQAYELTDDQILERIQLTSNASPSALNEMKTKMPKFRKAMASVTAGEIQYYRLGLSKTMRSMKKDGKLPASEQTIAIEASVGNEQHLRCSIASLRWCNKICNNAYNEHTTHTCKQRPSIGRDTQRTLLFCVGCYLVQYCCKQCQQEDWPKHKGICGNPNSLAREMGPQKCVFASQDLATGERKQILVDPRDLETRPGQ